MNIKRLRTLATLNEINASHMQNIFTPKENPRVRHNDIMVKSVSIPVDLVPKV